MPPIRQFRMGHGSANITFDTITNTSKMVNFQNSHSVPMKTNDQTQMLKYQSQMMKQLGAILERRPYGHAHGHTHVPLASAASVAVLLGNPKVYQKVFMPKEHYTVLNGVIPHCAAPPPPLGAMAARLSKNEPARRSDTLNLVRPSLPPRPFQKALPPSVKSTSTLVIQGPASASKYSDQKILGDEQISPVNYLKSLIEDQGYSSKTYASLDLNNFFLEMTPEHVADYDKEVIDAVRNENMDVLQEMKENGKNLQCCNRFGESIVHMSCRRGSKKVFNFLLDAGASIRVRDDYGRTPLHDACWTREPEFELMSILIKLCPDLLLVSDKRGHTPLSYARRDHWAAWVKFLHEHRELIVPTELPSR